MRLTIIRLGLSIKKIELGELPEKKVGSPYGIGNSAEKIVEILGKEEPLLPLNTKKIMAA